MGWCADVAAILLDEPLTVIDPHVKWLLRRKLKQVHEQLKVTLVYVTHDRGGADARGPGGGDEPGRVVQVGTPQELFERPADTFVGYFIGSPGMNPVHRGGRRGGGGGAATSAGRGRARGARAAGGEPLLGIRPEFLRRVPEGTPSSVRVEVTRVEDLGRHKLATARLGAQSLKVRLPEEERLAPGERAGWSSPPRWTTLYAGGSLSASKPTNHRAWLLVLPVLVAVAFSAVIPLMTVVNYSVQDILGPEQRVFVGTEWFRKVLRDPELHGRPAAAARLLAGGAGAGDSPGRGPGARAAEAGARRVREPGAAGPAAAHPFNVVGTIWQIFARGDIGLLGVAINGLGLSYNYTANALDAWLTVLAMDVWHWTPLVALLCYAGLRAIPDAYYQAARIDGALGVGHVPLHPTAPAARGADHRGAAALHGQLHDLHRALRAHRRRARQRHHLPEPIPDAARGGLFDLGPAALLLTIYFLVILLFSYVFYTAMTSGPKEAR